MFRIGQKVVCISPVEGGYGDEIIPIVGDIYVVRGIETNRPGGADPVGLFLEEIFNSPRHYRGYWMAKECSFSALKFRPVTERKTDISIFKAMLTPQGVEA